MSRLFSAIASLLLAMSVHAKDVVAPEYVSIDCPAGDISLLLKENRTFVLVLKHWDDKTQTHNRTETLTGSWSYKGDVLALKNKGNIVYRRNKSSLKVGAQAGEIDSFAWQSSTSPSFADSYVLLERGALDKLLMNSEPSR